MTGSGRSLPLEVHIGPPETGHQRPWRTCSKRLASMAVNAAVFIFFHARVADEGAFTNSATYSFATVYSRYRLRFDRPIANSPRTSLRSYRNSHVNGKQDQITGGFAIFSGGFGRFQALRGDVFGSDIFSKFLIAWRRGAESNRCTRLCRLGRCLQNQCVTFTEHLVAHP